MHVVVCSPVFMSLIKHIKLRTRIMCGCRIYIMRRYEYFYFSSFISSIKRTIFLQPLAQRKYSSKLYSLFLWIFNAPYLLLVIYVCNLLYSFSAFLLRTRSVCYIIQSYQTLDTVKLLEHKLVNQAKTIPLEEVT